MKTTIILFFAILFFQFAHAQTINFIYDDAGICILKYKTVTIQNIKNNVTDTTLTNPDSLEDIIDEIKVLILPNPTKGILHVEIRNTSSELSVIYNLTDIHGATLQTESTTSPAFIIDMSLYHAGTYLLCLNINGIKETYKIIRK